MGDGQDQKAQRDEEYHSYVLRVRASASPSRAEAEPTLSIRVEYVNERRASHFNELAGALDFIARSVRDDVLHTSA